MHATKVAESSELRAVGNKMIPSMCHVRTALYLVALCWAVREP